MAVLSRMGKVHILVLVSIMVFLHQTPTTSASAGACEKIRSDGSLEEVNAKVNFEDGTASGKVCLVKDGDPCLPKAIYDSEHVALMNYLSTAFPGYKTTLPPLLRVPVRSNIKKSVVGQGWKDSILDKTFFALELEFKSLFCRSGACPWKETWEEGHNNGAGSELKCATSSRDFNAPITIPYSQFLFKFRKLESDMTRTAELAEACSYVTQGKDKEVKYAPGTAHSQLTATSSVKTLKACFFEAGSPCFPMRAEDLKRYEAFEKKKHEEVRSNLLEQRGSHNPAPDRSGLLNISSKSRPEKRKSQIEREINCDPRVLDWFCSSGKCINGTCGSGPRKYVVMKWWEMAPCKPISDAGLKFPVVSTTLFLSAMWAVSILSV